MMSFLTIACEHLGDDVEVVTLRGTEALSQPYQLTLGIRVANNAEFDMDAAIGTAATITIATPGGRPVSFHGIFASIEHLLEVDQRALYEIVLVPRVWRLTQSLHSQVFVDKTIPQIVEIVLAAAGLSANDVHFNLNGAYTPQTHVCQYHESNFNFISRLLEREGIYYYFEQCDSHERIIITDHYSAHDSSPPTAIRYRAGAADDSSAGEALTAFRCRSRMAPATVQLRDYDYAKPSLDVVGTAAVWAGGDGEINVHGANFATPGEGARLANIRAEEIICRQKLFHGHGAVFQLSAGYLFQLAEHPRAAFNSRYLAVAVEHHANNAATSGAVKEALGVEYDEVYRVNLVAMPAERQFRPERSTPKPRIYGVENGVIDGAADSSYAQLNADGCYKVKIDFDEADDTAGRASSWVRMMQPHGGSNEGFHFPLRKGTEVLLTFLGGDPDRPVISGVMPNALNPSPVAANNHTSNVIQTGGFNRIAMEDLEGQQRTVISTPTEHSFLHIGAPTQGHYNVDLSTEGDGQFRTGRTWDVEVGSHNTEHVAGNVVRNHDKNQQTTVKLDKTLNVGGDDVRDVEGAQATHVSGDVEKTYQGNYNRNVKGPATTAAANNRYVEDVDDSGNVAIKTAGHFSVEAAHSGDDAIYIKAPGGQIHGETEKKGDDAIVFDCLNGQFKVNADRIKLLSADDAFFSTKLFKFEAIDGFSFYFGASTTTAMGITSNTFMGATNNNFFGLKVDFSLAVEIGYNRSLKYERSDAFGVSVSKMNSKSADADISDLRFMIMSNRISIRSVITSIEDIKSMKIFK